MPGYDDPTLTKEVLLGIKDCPPEMLAAKDEEWHWVARPPDRRPLWTVLCQGCEASRPDYRSWELPSPPRSFTLVDLRGALFVRHDGSRQLVYFGRCPHCNTVHWSRSDLFG